MDVSYNEVKREYVLTVTYREATRILQNYFYGLLDPPIRGQKVGKVHFDKKQRRYYITWIEDMFHWYGSEIPTDTISYIILLQRSLLYPAEKITHYKRLEYFIVKITGIAEPDTKKEVGPNETVQAR